MRQRREIQGKGSPLFIEICNELFPRVCFTNESLWKVLFIHIPDPMSKRFLKETAFSSSIFEIVVFWKVKLCRRNAEFYFL